MDRASRRLGHDSGTRCEIVGGKALLGPHDHVVGESPRAVHSERVEIPAIKRLVAPTRHAVAAQHSVVGGDELSDREVPGAVADQVHTPDDLVSGSERVARKKAALVDVQIRAAHAGHLDREADLARAGLGRGYATHLEVARRVVDDGSHVGPATAPPYPRGPALLGLPPGRTA